MKTSSPPDPLAVFANLSEVRVEGGFWGELMETNRRVALPIQYQRLFETGRLASFNLDWKPGQPNPPHIFWDSDIGKWIEAAAYSLAGSPDPELEERVDAAIQLVASAQQEDGYLNVHFTVVSPGKRWTNLRDKHELYCAGHLIEGAVAYFHVTGKRVFLEVVIRYARYLTHVFGPGQGQRRGYCGHEEIELALVKLYQVTNEESFLNLARFFIMERGSQPHYFDEEAKARGEDPKAFWAGSYEYCQAHLPVLEQKEVVGHAVRAMYLYAGMTDVAVHTGDAELLKACRRLWKNLVETRLHVTGGLGPSHDNEGFTTAYDLPNEGAYLETCAAIGLVFWAWRMLQVETNSIYADVMERALYNGTISGMSRDGEHFFYGNPLASQPGFDGNGRFIAHDYHYRRSEWFATACCPPNLARMIGQFPAYLYSVRASELAVHHFADSEARLFVAGRNVTLRQKTSYPWKEDIVLTVEVEESSAWTLAVRLPGWCRNPSLSLNGARISPPVRKGYARVRRKWSSGDEIHLHLPMPPQRWEAHPAVRQNCGRVALQRGPIVYCLEEADNGPRLHDIFLPSKTPLGVKMPASGELAGIPLLRFRGQRREPSAWTGQLYRASDSATKACQVTAIPYFLWANRSPGEMLVWIRSE